MPNTIHKNKELQIYLFYDSDEKKASFARRFERGFTIDENWQCAATTQEILEEHQRREQE